jgi:molybdopterin-guanine dinucleotide biosynthesis protein
LPAIIAIGGFSSNVGKTTLLCELLRSLPGWEAIKMTRGHYRSCGKDPRACCVSHLLGDEPLVYSGREQTYASGKDTGRYWEAGAANVHWVIATDNQLERGLQQALNRVQSTAVLIEGNSFLKYVAADFMIMVARAGGGPIKPTARRALALTDALYLSGDEEAARAKERFAAWYAAAAYRHPAIPCLPLYTREELPQLLARLREIQQQKSKVLQERRSSELCSPKADRFYLETYRLTTLSK